MSGSRWFKPARDFIASPFDRAHCVPLAFTSVQDRPTVKFALVLAQAAYHRVSPGSGEVLLYRRGSAAGVRSRGTADLWAQLANLRITDEFRPEVRYATATVLDSWGDPHDRTVREGRPTVAQFARSFGRRGRWIVFTTGHAQAVVNGKIRGWCSPRSRVHLAFKVETL